MDVHNNQGIRNRLANPLIIALILTVVVFITPAIMTINPRYRIFTSIMWVYRNQPGEPLLSYLTFWEIFAFHRYLLKYLFIFMVYRYYRQKTTFVRALVVGLISEIYLFVYNSFGSILHTLFPIPGVHPLFRDIVLPFAVLTFLILVVYIPPRKTDSDSVVGTWLDEADTEVKDEI